MNILRKREKFLFFFIFLVRLGPLYSFHQVFIFILPTGVDEINSFIQGGSGPPGTGPPPPGARPLFNTYCAPISFCNTAGIMGPSGEQNWQGNIHLQLSVRSPISLPALLILMRNSSRTGSIRKSWPLPGYFSNQDGTLTRVGGVVRPYSRIC